MPRLRPAVLIAVAVTVVLGAPAAPAGAKGIVKLAVCGPAGCVDRTRAAVNGTGDPHLLMDAGTPVAGASVVASRSCGCGSASGTGRVARSTGASRWRSCRARATCAARTARGRSSRPPARAALRPLTVGVPRFPAARLGLGPAPAPVRSTGTRASGDDGTPWGLIGGAVVALAAAAAAAFVVRRRLEDGRSPV